MCKISKIDFICALYIWNQTSKCKCINGGKPQSDNGAQCFLSNFRVKKKIHNIDFECIIRMSVYKAVILPITNSDLYVTWLELYFQTVFDVACPIITVLYFYLFTFLMFVIYLSLCLLVYVCDVFNRKKWLPIETSLILILTFTEKSWSMYFFPKQSI